MMRLPRTPAVLTLHVGEPEALGFDGAAAWYDEPWHTAIFKRRLDEDVAVSPLGLAGDGHADLVNHGGLDKAICVYPAVHYAAWQDELGLPDFADGAFGENITLSDLTEGDVCIGDIYRVVAPGMTESADDAPADPRGLVVQVSQPRQPCWKLARKWRIKDLTARAVATGRTGWYFRVLTPGVLRPGDRLHLVERPHSEWSVAAANLVMHHRVGDHSALAALAPLAASWKRTLSSRLP